jgi:hypothetical protein
MERTIPFPKRIKRNDKDSLVWFQFVDQPKTWKEERRLARPRLTPKQIKHSRRPQAIQSENVSKLKIKVSIPQKLLYTAKPSTSRYLKIKSQ